VKLEAIPIISGATGNLSSPSLEAMAGGNSNAELLKAAILGTAPFLRKKPK
jgi:hypothetical protein